MRAWLMESFDGVERLRLAIVADPRPGPGQVLLRMRYAALNPADAFLAQGLYPAKPPLPHVLGRDGVGDVIAVGADVQEIRAGQTVGILRCEAGVEAWGTLADLAVVPAASLTPVPTGWTVEEMAGAPLVFLTAWQALTQWSDPPMPPRPGSVVLITGASGGVGAASLLLGKALMLTIVALSRSEDKRARLKELGADFVFDPAERKLRETVRRAIAPKRVDLAIENVCGPLFNEVIAMLGQGGKVSVVGRSGGVVPEFNPASLFFRRNRIGGVFVGDYSPAVAQAVWKEIVGLLDTAGRRPLVDSIVPFEDVKSGFGRLAEGPMGKVLVRHDSAAPL